MRWSVCGGRCRAGQEAGRPPATDADTEQVEVNAHRGLQVDVALATPTSTRSLWSVAATNPVASII
jgi:hypothetical protein